MVRISHKCRKPLAKAKRKREIRRGRENKKRQTKNLTASTTYPCFRQDLGDSEGASSSDLPDAKIKTFYRENKTFIKSFRLLLCKPTINE